MRLGLGHGDRMRVDEVPDRGVSADEDEPPKGRTDAAGFEQPEQPLDRNIEDRLGRLLARRQVKHMGDALGRGVDDVAAVDRARDNLEPRRRLQQPVVAQRSDRDPASRSSREESNLRMNAWPTLPVAPVTRISGASSTRRV